ncbi:glucosaminidase domain-containing protein [Shumkonia mesophila]|uniref:glucosaminidase domain-containing protein n=1 Tax=Shumkonia mesophila TaxID=2838854 RepID=UPI00293436EC|nr:glucosaminidase domain-containing protein [Shumkonia mesophila]
MRLTREIFPARLGLVLAAVGGLALAACTEPQKTAAFCPIGDGETSSRVAAAPFGGPFVTPLSSNDVQELFTGGQAATGHRAYQERPLALAASLPPDLDALGDVERRKQAFVGIVLPLAHQTNQAILADRRFVDAAVACKDAGKPLAPEAQARLDALSATYKADGGLDTLRRRLDVVPPSLLLAQAAIESGWGTSRFAREGNALFGQRTTAADSGIKPQGLEETTPVRVATFPHLLASVGAYIHNLNTQPAYKAFRERRAALRAEGRQPDGFDLAATLIAYSERGYAYVGDLRTIIRGNRFDALDADQIISNVAAVESDA